MKKIKILVVDDEEGMRLALSEALSRVGYEILCCSDGVQALAKIRKENYSLIITDVKMPGMSGLALLREVKKVSPATAVIMITAYGTVNNAVEAMKEGASDYLMKPFSFEDLEVIITRVLASTSKTGQIGAKENTQRAMKPGRLEQKQIITGDPKMEQILKIARDIAPSSSTVLIQGESGTGKELLAQYIHNNSPRRNSPFVAINCAAIPDNLLESELFGHEKGAFTGATQRKVGKFELANKSTILLDEISEMAITLQAKLLRVLQEFEIDRVGGKCPVPVDVRVIATTNVDLKRAVNESKFREDLYYRLNVVPFTIPPLRERKGDIQILADYFVKKHSQAAKKHIRGIAPEAMDMLLKQAWKGNVRELENVVERAVLFCQDDILNIKHFMIEETYPCGGNSDAMQFTNMKDMEKKLIFKTLHEKGGNRTHAARALGISIRTLRNKLNEYKHNNCLESAERF